MVRQSMKYTLDYTDKAIDGLMDLKMSEPAAFKKARKLLKELAEHPFLGTGHPHPLTGDKSGQWARSITKKHRLVYSVKETEVIVIVLSAYGHYDDK